MNISDMSKVMCTILSAILLDVAERKGMYCDQVCEGIFRGTMCCHCCVTLLVHVGEWIDSFQKDMEVVLAHKRRGGITFPVHGSSYVHPRVVQLLIIDPHVHGVFSAYNHFTSVSVSVALVYSGNQDFICNYLGG